MHGDSGPWTNSVHTTFNDSAIMDKLILYVFKTINLVNHCYSNTK